MSTLKYVSGLFVCFPSMSTLRSCSEYINISMGKKLRRVAVRET